MTRRLAFTKMQGTGNDFVLIDATSPAALRGISPSKLARRLCDRRYGVGADQMLVVLPSKKADARMRIFNPDGSEAQMCGNGIRCLARYIWKTKKPLSRKETLEIETLAGIIKPERRNRLVRVDMGVPGLDASEIPVRLEGRVIDYPLRLDGAVFPITCVSMGNPHAVVFVEDVEGFPVGHYGPMIERHPLFPERANVEFVEAVSGSRIKMRVWERGAGETPACGTGASASAVAAILKGLTGRRVRVLLRGGELEIQWAAKTGRLYMTGPAEEVFSGEIYL